MLIVSNISTDLAKLSLPLACVDVVQGDENSRAIDINLTYHGEPWEIPDGIVASVCYAKADSTCGIYDTMPDGNAAWSVEGNVLRILLVPNMMNVAGNVTANVKMILDDRVLGTFSFMISVAPNPGMNGVDDGEYFNCLHWLESELDAHLEQAKLSGAFTGPVPNIQIGNVTTLPATSDATVSIRGDSENPILDFGIPRGAYCEVDASLSLEGMAADAKAAGNAISQKLSGGIHTLCPNGAALSTLGNGVHVLSVDSEHVPSIGIPEEMSAYGVLLVANGSFFQLIVYVDADGSVAYYSSSRGIWEIASLKNKAHIFESSEYPGCLYVKTLADEIQWVNPPTVVGEEYCTTERYMNKQIYTKLIDCGAAENQKTVSYNGGTATVRYTARVDGYALPLLRTDMSAVNAIWVNVGNSSLTIYTGGTVGGNVYVQVWYYK